MKAYLIDVWDIPERAAPQGCYAPAMLVLIKPRLYALLCALYFCFLPDPGIALCFRFFGGNLTRPPPDFVACVLGHT